MQQGKTHLPTLVGAEESPNLKNPMGEVELPVRKNLLEFHISEPSDGSTCALLTPAIKVKLREMLSGEVLEVRVDDPTARGDIEAWCRLSGNSLLNIAKGDGTELRYFIQKK